MWICNQKHRILNIGDRTHLVSYLLLDPQWWEGHMIDSLTIEWARGLELLKDSNLLIPTNLLSKEHFKLLCKGIEL